MSDFQNEFEILACDAQVVDKDFESPWVCVMSERVENMSGFIVGELDDCVIICVEKLLEVREVIFNSLFFIRQSFQVGVFQQAE